MKLTENNLCLSWILMRGGLGTSTAKYKKVLEYVVYFDNNNFPLKVFWYRVVLYVNLYNKCPNFGQNWPFSWSELFLFFFGSHFCYYWNQNDIIHMNMQMKGKWKRLYCNFYFFTSELVGGTKSGLNAILLGLCQAYGVPKLSIWICGVLKLESWLQPFNSQCSIMKSS